MKITKKQYNMGEIIVFSIGLLAILGVPIITALFARRMGRRPWLWFFMGLILPGIATVIIFYCPIFQILGNRKFNSKGYSCKT